MKEKSRRIFCALMLGALLLMGCAAAAPPELAVTPTAADKATVTPVQIPVTGATAVPTANPGLDAQSLIPKPILSLIEFLRCAVNASEQDTPCRLE